MKEVGPQKPEVGANSGAELSFDDFNARFPQLEYCSVVVKRFDLDGYPAGVDPINVPDFLKSSDYTVNSSIPTCVGIFIDTENIDNVTLQTIDCSLKVLAFCEIIHGFDQYTSSRGLPTIPCLHEHTRKKRESAGNEGI